MSQHKFSEASDVIGRATAIYTRLCDLTEDMVDGSLEDQALIDIKPLAMMRDEIDTCRAELWRVDLQSAFGVIYREAKTSADAAVHGALAQAATLARVAATIYFEPAGPAEYLEMSRLGEDAVQTAVYRFAECEAINGLQDECLRTHQAAAGLAHREPDSDQADGPAEPLTWRKSGTLAPGEMNQYAWNLVNHLWKRQRKACAWHEIAEPVYGDRNYPVDGDVVPSLRTKANRFFKKHKIPWMVRATKPSSIVQLVRVPQSRKSEEKQN